MFTKLFTVLALIVAVVAQASTSTGGDKNKCDVGSVQCCNSIQKADSKEVQKIAEGNSVVAAALKTTPTNASIGITCSPITAVGVAGNSCSAQPACCKNNNFNGVIAIDCSPINVNT